MMPRWATRWIRDPASALLSTTLIGAALYGCRVERERGAGDDVHPAGFEDPDAAAFHGSYLRESGYALAPCRVCHGDDYRGGAVEVSCTTSACHARGLEKCDTCHAERPETGSHPAHMLSCDTCHPPRLDARSAAHPGGQVEIVFSGLAQTGGLAPRFDAAAGTCAGTYCHGDGEPAWGATGGLACDSCHAAVPATHARYASAETDCSSCHLVGPSHVNGAIDVVPLGCDGCHGKGPLGAPPPGLFGSETGLAVGAHARHLDATISDRIGKIARCDDCHDVPATIDAPGHIDVTAPADVSLRAGESFDVATRACTVGCHWDRDPGPRWDDASGAARACDACHGMPPAKTRDGGAHPPTEPVLDACLGCHTFDPGSHVDGEVDFTW